MFRKSLLFLALLAAGNANAAVIYSDDFNADSIGLNTVPAGWSVSNGTVDIIGVGSSWNFFPAYGRYVDLDGSNNDAGLLFNEFDLIGGISYSVSFELAGSQRGDSNSVKVSFGDSSAVYNLQSSDVFTTYLLSFTPIVSGTYQLSFDDAGGDNLGALLDNVNVNVSSVPLPAASWLFLTSLLGILGLRRKVS